MIIVIIFSTANNNFCTCSHSCGWHPVDNSAVKPPPGQRSDDCADSRVAQCDAIESGHSTWVSENTILKLSVALLKLSAPSVPNRAPPAAGEPLQRAGSEHRPHLCRHHAPHSPNDHVQQLFASIMRQ